MTQYNWIVLVLFIAISFLNFLPIYFLNKSKIGSSIDRLEGFKIKKFFKNIIRRFNYDVFRFNGDLSFVVIFFLLFNINQAFATWLFFILFYFGFVYIFYYHIIKKTYNSEPLLINDIIFLKTGVTIAIGGFICQSILFLVGMGFIIIIFYYCSAFFIQKLFALQYYSFPLKFTLISSSLISLFSIFKYSNHPTIFGFLTCPSPTVHFFTNLFNSFKALKTTKEFNKLDFEALQEVEFIKMKEQPNFHFLVAESYGRIFFKNINKRLKQKCIEFEEELKAEGWKIISNFSQAPISGGASWLSYASLLKGIKIESHNKYHTLLKDTRHLNYYPFLKLLGKSGYKTFFLSALGGYKKVKINWKQLLRFVGADYLIKHKDLDYKGKEFGLGPSPPDQFSINKGFELMKNRHPNEPIAYFYITQNSHALWYSPNKVVDDWKVLSNKNFNGYGYIDDKELSVRYEKSIIYQLKTLVNFIIKQNEHNLFMIIGDHQPYNDKENEKDYLTPIHIISKDQNYINSFKDFGFTKGIFPQMGNELCHQAVQSMLLLNLQKRYGTDKQPKIKYYKNGVWL